MRFVRRLAEAVHGRGGEVRYDRACRPGEAGGHRLLLPGPRRAGEYEDVPCFPAPAFHPDSVVDLAIAQARITRLDAGERTPLPGGLDADHLVWALLLLLALLTR